MPPGELAEAACEIEIDVLKEPVGKQDQYVAAHGGICAYTFHPDDSVDVVPLELDTETLRPAVEQLPALLHRRGTRGLGACWATRTPHAAQDEEMLANLHRTKEMGFESRALLGPATSSGMPS